MTDPADIIAEMGYGWPGRVAINAGSCDPWFRMMADKTAQSDEGTGATRTLVL